MPRQAPLTRNVAAVGMFEGFFLWIMWLHSCHFTGTFFLWRSFVYLWLARNHVVISNFPRRKQTIIKSQHRTLRKKSKMSSNIFCVRKFLGNKILYSKRPSSPFPIHDHIFSISPFPLLGISFVWHFPPPSFGNRSRKGGGWKELSI